MNGVRSVPPIILGSMNAKATDRTGWKKRALEAEAALAAALVERNELWQELHKRAADEREIEYYRRLNAQIEGSLSWRLTAPLRMVKGGALKARSLLAARRAEPRLRRSAG